MPDKFLIRRKLLEQLGRGQYIKLVRSLPRTLRAWKMRYWQEEAWGTFCRANPDLAVAERDLPYLLRYCLRHGFDLELFPVPAIWWEVDFEPASERSLFPTEAPPSVMMMGEQAKTERIVPYWACPICTEIMSQRTESVRAFLLRGYAR